MLFSDPCFFWAGVILNNSNFLKSGTAQDMDNHLPVFSFSLHFFLVQDFWNSLSSFQVFVMIAHLCKWWKIRYMSISLALPALINLCLQFTLLRLQNEKWPASWNQLHHAVDFLKVLKSCWKYGFLHPTTNLTLAQVLALMDFFPPLFNWNQFNHLCV